MRYLVDKLTEGSLIKGAALLVAACPDARAIEAGTAETVKQGSVHESADPKGRAQDVSRSNEEGE